MPGEQIGDAIEAAVTLKAAGISAIFTKLGENITQSAEAAGVYAQYIDMLARSTAAGLNADISVKPSQLGYDQDSEACFAYCADLLHACEARGVRFWIDMEGSSSTQGTIDLFVRLRRESAMVGIAIQAYLLRTDADIEQLASLGSAVRMVKGAYLEPEGVAFADRSQVDEQYFVSCVRLLQPDAARPGALLHIGTHDMKLQERLLDYVRENGIPPSRYEFAMLYGINMPRQRALVQRGERVRCLVAYGEHWFPWYMRRLAERPANLWFVVRNLVRR